MRSTAFLSSSRAVYSGFSMTERSAGALSSAYARGEISPLEVTRALLARIEAWEPKINAMYRIDREGALEQAGASAALARRNGALAARRRAAHHQGKHLHARRPVADRHPRQ